MTTRPSAQQKILRVLAEAWSRRNVGIGQVGHSEVVIAQLTGLEPEVVKANLGQMVTAGQVVRSRARKVGSKRKTPETIFELSHEWAEILRLKSGSSIT